MYKLTKTYDAIHKVFHGTITLLWILHFNIMAGLLGGIHLELGMGIYKYELTIGIHQWDRK